jgi:predicted GTPase
MKGNGVRKAIIIGAAGRDFHNFNVFFKDNPRYRVVAFTAAQIPYIENRVYPRELAGSLYEHGIPIYPEHMLEELIKRYDVDEAFFSYSDVSHEHVMHIASRVLASGASFTLLGMKDTQLKASKPVIAVTATRTGAGKSTIARLVADTARSKGLRVGIVRHPMPYGEFNAVQHIKSIDDLDRLTLEEEEEYIAYLEHGYSVFAGVDYKQVLKEVESISDIIVWDGGNNDLPFFKPDHTIVVTDALRQGHELRYHPGEANLRSADTIVISKANLVSNKDALDTLIDTCKSINSKGKIFLLSLHATLDTKDANAIMGKRVAVVEDAPTVTHGEMSYSLGMLVAKMLNCKVVDGRCYAKGSIKDAYEKYPWIKDIIPALGYAKEQLNDLQDTLNSIDCDYIIVGTPADIARRLRLNKPTVRLRVSVDDYTNEQRFREYISAIIDDLIKYIK